MVKKGYKAEWKIKKIFEGYGWKVVRSGGSFGEADLICIKNGKCLFLQIKKTKKDVFYYYGYMKNKLEGFPFFVVVDFGYNNIRIVKPKNKIEKTDGENLFKFLEEFGKK